MTSELHEVRIDAVLRVIRSRGARTVIDLGCGDGDLVSRLVEEPQIEAIVGLDLAQDALRRLRDRLALAPGDWTRGRVRLVHGSMTETATAFTGFDCAVLLETIEHIEPAHLSRLERAVFAAMRPTSVVITTPNAEFNPLLGIPPRHFRHPGHRFEWGRTKFRQWARGVAGRHGYGCHCSELGVPDPLYGGGSQMAVFRLWGDEVGAGAQRRPGEPGVHPAA